jgi:hypothetical protein
MDGAEGRGQSAWRKGHALSIAHGAKRRESMAQPPARRVRPTDAPEGRQSAWRGAYRVNREELTDLRLQVSAQPPAKKTADQIEKETNSSPQSSQNAEKENFK